MQPKPGELGFGLILNEPKQTAARPEEVVSNHVVFFLFAAVDARLVGMVLLHR